MQRCLAPELRRGSEILLDIGPRLLTVLVEVGKNEEARASTCLAVDIA